MRIGLLGLLFVLLCGCAGKSPPNFTVITVDKPYLSATTEFVMPAGGPTGIGGAPAFEVRLPKGTAAAGDPFSFTFHELATITIIPGGEADGNEYGRLVAEADRPNPPENILSAGDPSRWLGTEAVQPSNGLVYQMASSQGTYTLQVNWSAGPAGEAFADLLTRDVMWSYRVLVDQK